MATWREDIAAALTKLGGVGNYQEIYAEVAARRGSLPDSWQATVRGAIEQASSDSANYRPGAPDIFYSVDGLGRGAWGLRGYVEAVSAIAEAPQGGLASMSQGYRVDSVVRGAIERHAVDRACQYYEMLGSASIEELGKPFDLRVHLHGTEIHVEVKGSTHDLESVTLTRNEVEHARATKGTHLFVVDRIGLMTGVDGSTSTYGGRARVWTGWVPLDGSLSPIAYRHKLGDGQLASLPAVPARP